MPLSLKKNRPPNWNEFTSASMSRKKAIVDQQISLFLALCPKVLITYLIPTV